jgi:hypothetical protein
MDETDQKQITAKAKCGGLSTAAANTPPSFEMALRFEALVYFTDA